MATRTDPVTAAYGSFAGFQGNTEAPTLAQVRAGAVLGRGHEGVSVLQISRALDALDIAPRGEARFYGPVLEERVRAFQRRHGLVSLDAAGRLTEADGVQYGRIEAATLDALTRAVYANKQVAEQSAGPIVRSDATPDAPSPAAPPVH